MMYKITALSCKPHYTDNYLLAQLVQKDLETRFNGNARIENYSHNNNRFLLTTMGSFRYKFPIGNICFEFSIFDWPKLKNVYPKYIKRSKELNRPYLKIYGDCSVLVLSNSQAQIFKYTLFRNSQFYDEVYREKVEGLAC